jgi:hypothetical protein
MVKETVGSGITRRTRRTVQSTEPSEISEAFSRWNDRLKTLWGANESILHAAMERLAEIKSVTPSPVDDLDAHNAVFARDYETEGWYLHSISIEMRVAELAMKDGNPNEAVQAALKIGELLTELRFQELWEPAALAGAASLNGARQGAAQKRAAYAHRDAEIRAAYEDKLPAMGEVKAKRSVAKQFGLAVDRIRRIVK